MRFNKKRNQTTNLGQLKMKKILSLTTSCAVLALAATSAQAQSMDYTTMQEMFGEPVTTSANGSPMRQSDVPMDMTIISAEEIARYPAREIPDVLRHYAGMSVRKHDGTSYSVGIRGYNPPGAERLLVLVNGRQVYQDFFGVVNWASIPVQLNEIQQIEIVRGPNTALFGFNAVSGVVNIITKNPIYDDVDYIQGDIGINGYARSSGAVTLTDEGLWGMRLSAGNSYERLDDNLTSPADVGLFHETDNAGDLNVDTSVRVNDSTTMRFEGSYSSSAQNSITAYFDGTIIDEKSSGVKAEISSDTDYGIVEATLYRNSLDSVYTIVDGAYGFNNDVIVARLSDTFQIGNNHTFRIAAEYRDNEDKLSLNGNVFSTSSYHINSYSGLWYWTATPKLSFSTAVRYDHAQADLDGGGIFVNGLFPGNPFSNDQYNNRYDEFGYNFGALYKLTDVDVFRFNASKGIDMPSLFEVGFQVSAGGLTYYADPTIEASDVHDFQLGYERRLNSLNGSFKATGFYQKINEFQGFNPLSTTLIHIGNIGDSKVYGVELSLDGETENNIRWGINYSYSRVNDDLNNTLQEYENLNSDHMIKGNIGYSPNEKLDMDAFLAYESDYTGIRGYNTANINLDIDPDVIVDARVAYKPTEKWTVSVNGQALFGDNEQSSYGEETDTQLFLRAKYDF